MSESTATFIPCRVGRFNDGCFIQSPRTGNRISFTREIMPVLPRVWGRILQKLSMGTLVVPFTPDELRAVKAFCDAQAEHEAAKHDDPPLHFGMNRTGLSEYGYFCTFNRSVRPGGYALRADDTFTIDCHTTDWPPFGLGLWFRHPCGPAMVVAGQDKESLPAAIVAKFNGKSAVFTGAELNTLYAACTATHQRIRPVRSRTIRRYRGF